MYKEENFHDLYKNATILTKKYPFSVNLWNLLVLLHPKLIIWIKQYMHLKDLELKPDFAEAYKTWRLVETTRTPLWSA